MKILAVSGSLRSGSYNTALLKAAASLAPESVKITLAAPLDRLPFFNPDLEADAIAGVTQWRNELREADALLIAAPEYAHAIPGVLKNALDWIVGSGELIAKPVAVINASPTHLGADKAHEGLLYTINLLDANLIREASMHLGTINKKINAEGNLTDEPTIERLRDAINTLAKAVIKG